VNSLVKALDDHGIPPNANVWAELGTTWREVMRAPTEAAHVLGKLLSRVGEDRVLWGTDGIWYGSPQPQIMAFRAFQFSAEFQEQFGYRAHRRTEAEGVRAKRACSSGSTRRTALRHRRRCHHGAHVGLGAVA
jgi:hypothetical protein